MFRVVLLVSQILLIFNLSSCIEIKKDVDPPLFINPEDTNTPDDTTLLPDDTTNTTLLPKDIALGRPEGLDTNILKMELNDMGKTIFKLDNNNTNQEDYYNPQEFKETIEELKANFKELNETVTHLGNNDRDRLKETKGWADLANSHGKDIDDLKEKIKKIKKDKLTVVETPQPKIKVQPKKLDKNVPFVLSILLSQNLTMFLNGSINSINF